MGLLHFVDETCDKCIHHYLLDWDESRCRRIKIGMSDVMCVQVKVCEVHELKEDN